MTGEVDHWVTAFMSGISFINYTKHYPFSTFGFCGGTGTYLSFENCKMPMDAIMSWIIRLYSHYPISPISRKKVGIQFPPLLPNGIIGTFDGAVQGGICGGGGTLTVAYNHCFHFLLGLGFGTNTKAELVALWALLRMAREQKIDNISILGDSKAIIGWARKEHPIRVNKLLGWINRTAEIIDTFQHIKFQHLYREHNSTADRLSKRGLRVKEGFIYIEETLEGSRCTCRSTRFY